MTKAAAVIGCALAAVAAGAAEVDGVAARVDSSVILKSDVIQEMIQRGATKEQYAAVREEMVARKLILKAAGESKMVMQDWVVENRVREVIERNFGGDRNRLLDTLSRQRVSYPEWRRRLQDDLVVQAMRWQMVGKYIVPSPSEMRAEYVTNAAAYNVGRRVSVSVVLLKPEQAAKRAEVSAALRKGEKFESVAKRYSQDSKAHEGGAWKDVDPAKAFRPEVGQAIDALAVGATSAWIDLDGWSFLLRKDAETPPHKMTFLEAYDRVEERVRARLEQKAYEAWIARLKAASYVKIL